MADTSKTSYSFGEGKKNSFIHHLAGKTQILNHHENNMTVTDNKIVSLQQNLNVKTETDIKEEISSVNSNFDTINYSVTDMTTSEFSEKNNLELQVALKKILEVSSNLMCVINNDIIFMMNKSGAEMLGRENGNDFCGRTFSGLVTNKDRAAFRNISGIIDSHREVLTKIIKDNGVETDCIIRVGYLKRDDTSLYIVEARPVADSSRLKDDGAINGSLLYDNLTGMNSSFLFFDRLTHSINKDTNAMYRHPVYPVKLTVMAVDISDLDTIRQVYGGEIADFTLKTLTDRINNKCKGASASCHCGYDSILLLFEDIEDVENAELMAKMLFEILSEPIIYEYNRLTVDCRIGIAMYPLHKLNADDLVKSAKNCAVEIRGTDRKISSYSNVF